MGKLYQGHLRLIVWPQTEQTIPSLKMKNRELTITAMSVCSRQSGKLLTRTEFYAELKRMSAKEKSLTKNEILLKSCSATDSTARIVAIKALREVSDLGLKEAKNAVDALCPVGSQIVSFHRGQRKDVLRALSMAGFKF